MLLAIECGVALVLAVLALTFPRLGSSWFASVEARFVALAHRKKLALLTVALLALAARAAVLPILPEPQPYVNDEFSYLLAADTFAHGRLTNPPHPLWIHFESLNEIQQPTYASIYPPGEGLVLALGQVSTGHPFVGVWLSVGLLCAALCWMLQGWFSPSWALLGGVLAVLHFAVFSYWANSYWGGAVAATGGALVMGALPRLKGRQRVRDALLMGLGAVILANSRPYEGLVFCLPVAVALGVWTWRGPRPPLRVVAVRVLAPLGLVLSLGALCTCYYFWRVTGNPFRMPYQVAGDTYAVTPHFIWQSRRPEPAYHHRVLRDFYTHNWLALYQQARTPLGMLAGAAMKFGSWWMFYLGPLLTLPLAITIATLPLGFKWRSISWEARFLLVTSGTFFCGLALEVYFSPHYAAPLTSVVFLLLVLVLRHLRQWRWQGQPAGGFLIRGVLGGCVFLLALRAAAGPLHLPITPDWPPTWLNGTNHLTDRARILAQLEAHPGKQLVIVRYAPHSQPLPETLSDWVHNRADIDQAKVVWALDMGAAGNQELVDYYEDRQVWRVEPDASPPRLTPYPEKASP